MPETSVSNGVGLTVAKILTVGVCLIVALVILWLAVPRAVAGAIMFGSQNTLIAARRGKVVTPADVQRLIAAQRSALAWSDSGESWIHNGYMLLYSTIRSPRIDKTVNRAAGKALYQGLSQMPVNAEGWYWLAVVRQRDDGASTKVASALRMSIFTGPHVPVLAIVRLRLMLRNWRQYSVDERNSVYRQIQFAWSVSPDGVVNIAVNSRNDWPIRIALALQPDDLKKFEEMLTEAKSKLAK